MLNKKYGIGLAFILLIGGSYLALNTGKKEALQSMTPPPLEVEVLNITPRAIRLSKTFSGRTHPYRIAEIRPQVNGIVVKRLFEEGSEVKEGQQLYQIDSSLYQAMVDKRSADLQKAEANFKALEVKVKRFEELAKIGSVSKQEHDDLVAALSQSAADISIAQAALKEAQINLEYTKVISPISGRIGKSMVSEGALVTANQPNVLTIIQQLDPIYVDVARSSCDLLKMRHQFGRDGKSQKVNLIIEGEERFYNEEGNFQFSDVMVDPSTGNIQMRILFSNPREELLPGMFVRVQFEQKDSFTTLLIPQCAVSRHPHDRTTVWLVDSENKTIEHPIKVSDLFENEWMVLEGLNEGDRIVTAGIQKIVPNSTVTPVPIQNK